VLDKGKNVLATFDWQKTKEEYVFQLSHAGDIVDRIVAARELRQFNGDSVVFEALEIAALRDRFWAVRNEALVALKSSENPCVKQTLLEA
ncbi:MAG TPA: hypothetical protein DGH68_08360, partial [Bacteroidetes bacterium]|nr:hypothetical protein [Bacteroidota bacterium]